MSHYKVFFATTLFKMLWDGEGFELKKLPSLKKKRFKKRAL